MLRIPLCMSCKHSFYYQGIKDKPNHCDAFPDGEGIPLEIRLSRFDHHNPYPGDHGIQYEPREGTEEPDNSRIHEVDE